MSYLEEFQKQINNRDFHKFFQLWEEYCTSDNVEAEEFTELLDMIIESDFAKLFGQFVETAIPLWRTIEDKEESYSVLKRLIDLQTTNSQTLAELTLDALTKRYGSDVNFKEKIRQAGLRTMENFQGAISNYELLTHLEAGNFVFHTSGWGTGEIMEVSLIREQVAIEFENVTGIKHLTFDNAFKTLVPLPKEHFLARRFSDPDRFEEEARNHPVKTIKTLLRDLGPQTASEIKDEMCDLVIPEKDWSKWWQSTRAKLKKDTMVECPASLRDPFILRSAEVSHEEQLHSAIEDKSDVDAIVQTSYSYARDFPHMFKKAEVKESLKNKLLELLRLDDLTIIQRLQILIFLESMFAHHVEGQNTKDFIRDERYIENIINKMDIVAFKKRALVTLRETREDWAEIFISMLHSVQQSTLKDYVLKELSQGSTRGQLEEKLAELIEHPERDPEIFFWYFQKLAKKESAELPFADREGLNRAFEAMLILLHKVEHEPEYKDLTKKIYNYLTAKRFAIVREMIEDTDMDFIQEFLLLVSKCHVFSELEKKIMRSLAQVVHPSLAPKQNHMEEQLNEDTIWTTEAGYLRTQERIKHIATVEMIENAKEVEAARALGDLRENAEYKFACERRARLQGELKVLSKLLGKARIITRDDIFAESVGVGSVVQLQNSEGGNLKFTLLGPWDTNPEENIISYQSQLAQSMHGKKVGDSFTFKEEEYKVVGLKSYLD